MITAIKQKRKHAIKTMVLTIVAGVLTGAEALLSMGFDLPLSHEVPGWLRALLIVSVTTAAMVFRYLSQRAARA